MKKRKSSGYEAPPAYERELPVRPVVVPKAPSASWQKIPNRGPVPVARPAEFIQLTPIVQPIPLVPYSTQTQPLAMYDDPAYDDYGFYDDNY